MRKQVVAMVVAAMLAGTTFVNSAFSAPPPWQYGWWQRGPGGQWRWVGAWGPGGRWVRNGPGWVYQWGPPAPWRYAWWVRGPAARWVWTGWGWGPGGTWIRRGPNWVYRWR
jgi:hypothetical protein